MKKLVLLKSFNPEGDPIVIDIPIIQGGMGGGKVSYESENYEVGLPSAVCREGGLGVASSVALDRLVAGRLGLKGNLNMGKAVKLEIELIKKKCRGRSVGINIMRVIDKYWKESILGALDGGVDVIISGAGLAKDLPEIVATHPRKKEVSLLPIIASEQGARVMVRLWKRYSAVVGGIVVEGPKAGGHIVDGEPLEIIFPAIKRFALKNGNFPVIVAGGIRTREHFNFWLNEGIEGLKADGVQMGSIFAASYESGACKEHKKAIVNGEELILLDKDNLPSSPCGLPFRAFVRSPMLLAYKEKNQLEVKSKCLYGYVAQKDKETGQFTVCAAKQSLRNYFCICAGLMPDSNFSLFSSGAPYKAGKIIPRIKGKGEFATVFEIFQYFLKNKI